MEATLRVDRAAGEGELQGVWLERPAQAPLLAEYAPHDGPGQEARDVLLHFECRDAHHRPPPR
jgi:hypothetical protein